MITDDKISGQRVQHRKIIQAEVVHNLIPFAGRRLRAMQRKIGNETQTVPTINLAQHII
jgi:hypothetical protein